MNKWTMLAVVAVAWALLFWIGVLLYQQKEIDKVFDLGDYYVEGSTDDELWILPDGLEGLSGAGIYKFHGIEADGTYWWWCGGKWVQTEPPVCEIPE